MIRSIALLVLSLGVAACGDVKPADNGNDAGPGGDGGQCTAESETQLCSANQVECGPASLTDSCGDVHDVASCGVCATAIDRCSEQGKCVGLTPLDWQNPATLSDTFVMSQLAFALALTPSHKLYFTDGSQIGLIDIANQSFEPVVSDLAGCFYLFADGEKIYFTDNGGDPKSAVGTVQVYDPAANPPVSVVAEGLVNPSSVYVSPEGDIYIRNDDFNNVNSAVRVLRGGNEPLVPIKENLEQGLGRHGTGLWVEPSGDILLTDLGQTSPGTTGVILRLAANGSSIEPIASNVSAPSYVLSDANGDIIFQGLVDADPNNGVVRGGLYVLPTTDPTKPTQIIQRQVFAVAHGDGEIFYSTARNDPQEIRVIRNP